jgi:hypothetical protein
LQSTKPSKKHYRVPKANGDPITIDIDPRSPAESDENMVVLLNMMALLSNMGTMSEKDVKIFKLAFSTFKISFEEAYLGIWKAFADAYVPSTGIEFKHIYKHIEERRKANDGVLDNNGRPVNGAIYG